MESIGYFPRKRPITRYFSFTSYYNKLWLEAQHPAGLLRLSKKAAGRKSSINSEKKLQSTDFFSLFIQNIVGPEGQRFCFLRRAPAAFQTASEPVKKHSFLTRTRAESETLCPCAMMLS